MKTAKRLISAAFTAALVFCFIVNAVAFSIDGLVGAEEWKNVACEDLAEGGTGCDIENLLVRYDLQTNKGLLYIAIQSIQLHTVESLENCGISITVNDLYDIMIFPDRSEYDKDRYDVKTAFSQQTDGVTMEAKIAFKGATGENMDFSFTVFDSFGNESKQFNIFMQDEVEKQEDSREESTASAKKEKTTKQKTTKAKTTKAKSSKSTKYSTVVYSTVNPNDYQNEDNEEIITVDYENGEESADEKQEFKKIARQAVIKTLAAGVGIVSLAVLFATVRKKKNI